MIGRTNPYLSAGNRQAASSYAAGRKMYGAGRDAPNIGPVDKLGYRERDGKLAARRNAVLRRIQAGQRGAFGHADWNREGVK